MMDARGGNSTTAEQGEDVRFFTAAAFALRARANGE